MMKKNISTFVAFLVQVSQIVFEMENSRKFNPEISLFDFPQSLLGSTIDDHWSRVTKDRQVRRENLEKGFHMKKHNNLANKMSKICCPYQSMPIPVSFISSDQRPYISW